MLIEIRSGEKACDTFSVYVKKDKEKAQKRLLFSTVEICRQS